MIDAHQHLWQIGAHGCTWPTADLARLHRDFSAQELTELAAPLGVRGSVLVQSQPCDQDTDYLLELAAREPFVRALVGWVDLASPSAVARINHLGLFPKLRGLRPMLQSLPDDRWILRDDLLPAINAIKSHQLVFDALIFPRHLPVIDEFALRHPELNIVVDHAAKPAIAAGAHGLSEWQMGMQALAARPNIQVKVSGLLTEAGADQGEEALRPYLDFLVQTFGTARLMWGSDWPVLIDAPNQNLATYSHWLQLVWAYFSALGEAAVADVFTNTCQRTYRFE